MYKRELHNFFLQSVILLCLAICANGQKRAPINLKDFLLKNIKGENVYFQFSKVLPTVVIFLSPECPLCQKYSLVLNKLHTTFNGKTDIVGIFTGNGYSNSQYEEFKTKYRISFKLFVDKKSRLAGMLHASITPEAFFVNSEGLVLYQGAIDDWYVSLGKNKPKPSQNYLEDALAHYFNKQPISPAKTNPIGCLINFELP